jgi:hypothetical protein
MTHGMNFEHNIKIHAMKKLLIFLLTLVAANFLIAANYPGSEEKLSRSEKKAAKQIIVKEAVESKRFAIEFERLHIYRYGIIDLNPGNNYIIVSGDKAAIRAGYMGRQIGTMPIAGIKLTGNPSYYKMEKGSSNGAYKIEMEVKGETDTFHINITVSENGTCNTTISANRIDNVRYTGTLIPIAKQKEKVPEPDAIKI